MKQRLCIGLQTMDEQWMVALDQIGVSYEKVNYSLELASNYSVIILNTYPDSHAITELHQFMKDGGSLIEMKGVHPFLHEHHFYRKNAQILYNNTSNKDFEHIPALSIYREAEFHQEAKLFGGMIHFQVWKRGVIGFYGVDLPLLLQQTGYKRRRFFSESGLFPDEIVSKVTKQALIDAFTITLRQLHYRRSLPFVNKWSSPVTKPVFGFRIDTDYGNQESIINLYKILKKHAIKGTWFLHVEAHKEWLQIFKGFKEQELALHGYEHGTSKAVSKTRQNIRNGLEVLTDNDIKVNGFCAPYGIWNKALEQTLKDFEFRYTSEFTYLFDGFPLKPENDLPMQIPVHPICTGSLSRKNYDEAAMAVYFAQILQQKLGRFKPVFFYHHPLQKGLIVWDHLFEIARQQELHIITFSEFLAFWEKRNKNDFNAIYDQNTLVIHSNSKEMYFQYATDHTGFSLIRAGQKVELHKSNEFQYSNYYLPSTKQTRKLFQKDLRLLKTSILDWKNRNKL
ncbi:MAG: polysaccharide deacetylase family protein [Gracilimonas sp.]|nr:polysaccharide deacetylase family protein [Gracilimonas sp.]